MVFPPSNEQVQRAKEIIDAEFDEIIAGLQSTKESLLAQFTDLMLDSGMPPLESIIQGDHLMANALACQRVIDVLNETRNGLVHASTVEDVDNASRPLDSLILFVEGKEIIDL